MYVLVSQIFIFLFVLIIMRKRLRETMAKIKEFYQDTLCGAEIDWAFKNACDEGIKELEFTKEEFRCFLNIFSQQIPAESDVAGGEFIFWGVRIKRENDNQ